jgi:O-antigen/teichoic acid export membrane protein
MSGNQRRLIRVQAVMAVVMVILSVQLIPYWGAVGAAVAAAITNAGTNAWNLLEVRKAMHLSPYNRSYLKLLPSVLCAVLTVLVLRRVPLLIRHDWAGIMVALLFAYGIFSIVAFAMGLDADDRLIANAIRTRVGKTLWVGGHPDHERVA